MKKHSKALVFFAVSKQIPITYSAERGRAKKNLEEKKKNKNNKRLYMYNIQASTTLILFNALSNITFMGKGSWQPNANNLKWV